MAARAALGMVVRKDVNEGKGREGEGRWNADTWTASEEDGGRWKRGMNDGSCSNHIYIVKNFIQTPPNSPTECGRSVGGSECNWMLMQHRTHVRRCRFQMVQVSYLGIVIPKIAQFGFPDGWYVQVSSLILTTGWECWVLISEHIALTNIA
jgi:hypothetical protein